MDNKDVTGFGAPVIHISELKVDEGKLLGKGQFGHVYQGLCRGLPVAVKILKVKSKHAKKVHPIIVTR